MIRYLIGLYGTIFVLAMTSAMPSYSRAATNGEPGNEPKQFKVKKYDPSKQKKKVIIPQRRNYVMTKDGLKLLTDSQMIQKKNKITAQVPEKPKYKLKYEIRTTPLATEKINPEPDGSYAEGDISIQKQLNNIMDSIFSTDSKPAKKANDIDPTSNASTQNKITVEVPNNTADNTLDDSKNTSKYVENPNQNSTKKGKLPIEEISLQDQLLCYVTPGCVTQAVTDEDKIDTSPAKTILLNSLEINTPTDVNMEQIKKLMDSMTLVNGYMGFYLGLYSDRPLIITTSLACTNGLYCEGYGGKLLNIRLPYRHRILFFGDDQYTNSHLGISFAQFDLNKKDIDFINKYQYRVKKEIAPGEFSFRPGEMVPLGNKQIDWTAGLLNDNRRIKIVGLRVHPIRSYEIQYFIIQNCRVFPNQGVEKVDTKVTFNNRINKLEKPKLRFSNALTTSCPFIGGAQGALVLDEATNKILGFVWDMDRKGYFDKAKNRDFIHRSYIIPINYLAYELNFDIEKKINLYGHGSPPFTKSQWQLFSAVRLWSRQSFSTHRAAQ